MLVEEALLCDLIQEDFLHVATQQRLEEWRTLRFITNEAHLDDEDCLLRLWSRRQEDVDIELGWCSFRAISDVFEKRRRGSRSEVAVASH